MATSFEGTEAEKEDPAAVSKQAATANKLKKKRQHRFISKRKRGLDKCAVDPGLSGEPQPALVTVLSLDGGKRGDVIAHAERISS